jgi:rhomboid protease GluP
MFILDSDSLKKARITIYLISVNVIIYILSFISLDYLFLFAQINYVIFNNFELWRLFTAMFFHADTLHLISNMFGLLIFGSFVELSYSKYGFIFIYLISGLIGNIFSLFMLPLNSLSLGASGAIFGLIGASLILIFTENNRSLILIGLVYLLYFIISSFTPGVNYFAHIFGLIGGFILGYLLPKKSTLKDYYK